MGNGKKFFITSVGTLDYKNAVYTFNDKFFETKFASEAIYRLVDNIADAEVLVFSTNEALEKYGNDLKTLINAECIPVPFAKEEKGLREVFETINKKIEIGSEIVIDITNAFRSLQMIYFAIMIYLTALKHVTIKGIYYGAYEDRDESTNPPKAPVVDLTPIFNMIKWFYAVQIFNDYGLAKPVAKIIENVMEFKPKSQLKALSSQLKEISDGLYNVDVRVINDAFLKLSCNRDSYISILSGNLPIAQEVFDSIINSYKNFGIDQNLIPNRQNTYTDLTQDELDREKNIIDWYINLGQIKNALTIMREWIVNKIMLQKKKTHKWLVHKNRIPFEKVITGLNIRYNKKNLTSDLKEFANNAEKIFKWRDYVSHGGFTSEGIPKALNSDQSNWEEIRKIWQYFKEFDWSKIDKIFFDGKKEIKTLYITSLGLSKGVLYTLLKNITPADTPCHFLIISSDESQKSIPECFEKAEVKVNYTCWNLADPHKDDFDKNKFINTPDYIDLIHKSDKIIINFAGGTSAMQFHVKGIAEVAESCGTDVVKILTIDRRSPEEQRKYPFVKGEIIKI